MNRTFKIHCSAISKIMGTMGLTENQIIEMNELSARKALNVKPLTKKMEADLASLTHRHLNPELPTGCKTFLMEWYADDKEQIWSKYTDKGNYVEVDLIEFMAEQLGFGLADKNHEQLEDDYFIGTCDVVLPNTIVDVKAPWNIKTLQENCTGIDFDYEWQGRGYMRLWKREKFILFYGLMNTPEEVAGFEVNYDHLAPTSRWIAYQIDRNELLEQLVIERVKLCRKWLVEYDKLVQSKLGKIHSL